VPEDFSGSGFRGETVEFSEDFRLSVFDELIRPADEFDRCVDRGLVEVVNDTSAKAIE
jgi:hypothetical protein